MVVGFSYSLPSPPQLAVIILNSLSSPAVTNIQSTSKSLMIFPGIFCGSIEENPANSFDDVFIEGCTATTGTVGVVAVCTLASVTGFCVTT